MAVPILSRNAPTQNVLLKITVPRRTGRRRKHGSQEPFSGDIVKEDTRSYTSHLRSQSRLDDPDELLKALKDNLGRYEVEAVATIDHTHRFRGKQCFLTININ
jgi:general transcription factor 3C polypeptide 5 (transcription factor C subunit 1)